jgi:membrane-associated protease RseP (regulator of RpoE activity)
MGRFSLALVVILVLGFMQGQAQTGDKSPGQAQSRDKSLRSEQVLAMWGVRLVAIPELLYSHLAILKNRQGVVIDQLTPFSPAALAHLQLHDILLSCNGEAIRDGDQFSKLVLAAKVNQKVPLVVLRGGKEKTLEVAFVPAKTDPKDERGPLKGSSKSNGPAAIDVVATSLGGGKLQVTFDYYLEGNSGKLHTLECSGTLKEIEARDVPRLPQRLQKLALTALQQIRDLNFK